MVSNLFLAPCAYKGGPILQGTCILFYIEVKFTFCSLKVIISVLKINLKEAQGAPNIGIDPAARLFTLTAFNGRPWDGKTLKRKRFPNIVDVVVCLDAFLDILDVLGMSVKRLEVRGVCEHL